jgi:hypothetical protein
LFGWCFAIYQHGRIMSISDSKGITSKVSLMKCCLYWSSREYVKAYPTPNNGQPSAPLILRDMSQVIIGRLCSAINLELMIGIAMPVSNIIQMQNVCCPGTERYIWTIGWAPARRGLFFTSCNVISDSFLLGFDFFDCFWSPWVLVRLTPVTEILCDPDISSFSWLPLHII